MRRCWPLLHPYARCFTAPYGDPPKNAVRSRGGELPSVATACSCTRTVACREGARRGRRLPVFSAPPVCFASFLLLPSFGSSFSFLLHRRHTHRRTQARARVHPPLLRPPRGVTCSVALPGLPFSDVSLSVNALLLPSSPNAAPPPPPRASAFVSALAHSSVWWARRGCWRGGWGAGRIRRGGGGLAGWWRQGTSACAFDECRACKTRTVLLTRMYVCVCVCVGVCACRCKERKMGHQ